MAGLGAVSRDRAVKGCRCNSEMSIAWPCTGYANMTKKPARSSRVHSATVSVRMGGWAGITCRSVVLFSLGAWQVSIRYGRAP